MVDVETNVCGVRRHLIALGLIKPFREGDPTPVRWVDAPTLRLDAAAARELRRPTAVPKWIHAASWP